MQEIRCHRCGAIALASSIGAMCPECGASPQTVIGRMWSKISRYVWLTITLMFAAYFEHPLGRDSKFSRTLLFTVIVGVGWAIWKEARRERRYQPAGTGQTQRRKFYESPMTITPSPADPPEALPEWRPLVELPRPRDVYVPSDVRTKILWDALYGLGGLAFVIVIFLFRVAGPERWSKYSFHGVDAAVAAILIVTAWQWSRLAFHELSARALLRDGDIVIGRITDWYEGEHGKSEVCYQFWTRTGKRYEHTGNVVSEQEYFKEKDFVPVFYLPEDPAKSVALCCATSRVRLPDGSFARSGKAVPLRS